MTTTQRQHARWATYGLLAAGMALFGSATPVSKIVGAAFPAMLGSTLRMLTAAVVLLPVLVVQRHRGDDGRGIAGLLATLDRRDWLLVLGIAAVGTFGFTLLLLYGLRVVPGAVGAIVMATTPAVTAIGSVLFLHDRLDRWKAAGIGLAVAGVVAVNLGGGAGGAGGNLWLGSLLVFGAVCCEAAYTLLGKRLSADLSPVAIASLAAVLAGVLFAPLALAELRGFDWSQPTWGDWLAVAWWGAGTMGLGSLLWFRGVMRVAGTTASGFMAVMPVSALLLSYVLLGESFSWIHVVGMAGVLAGIAAVTRGDASNGSS